MKFKKKSPNKQFFLTILTINLGFLLFYPQFNPAKPTAGAVAANRSVFAAAVQGRTSEEAMSVEQPVTMSWHLLPPETSGPPIESEVIKRYSDLDPETLRLLKRQPWVPSGAPLSSEVEEDDSTMTGPLPLAPNLLTSFEGVDASDQPDGNLHRPPDCTMAVGTNHIMTAVNSMFAVYNKSGTLLTLSSLSSWFSNVLAGAQPFDPRIIYDPSESRWAMVALHGKSTTPGVSTYLLSVSQTSDPTGLWWNYALTALLTYPATGEDTWADFPDLGFDGIPSVSGGAIYITSNQFTFGSSPSFRTGLLNILPKSALYAGLGFNYWRAWDRTNSDGTKAASIRASLTYGNPGMEFLINTKNLGSSVSVWRVNPTYPPTAIDWTLQTTLSIGNYGLPPDAKQPVCGSLLDTSDNRISSNAVWRNNRLYAAFVESHDWGGGGGTVAAIRYLKVNTTSNSADLNVTFGADGFDYFFPAIATDNSENIVLTFARSGPQEFAATRFTGRRTTDSATQASALLKSGVQCITGDRWGDYFSAVVDPAIPSRVWLYGEWAADLPGIDSMSDWGTWIGRVEFPAISGPGTTTVGLHSGATSTFFLKNSHSGGAADATFAFGPAGAGWKPLAGDWNGDGIDTIGLLNPATSTFFLKNSLSGGAADIVFTFGPAGAGWLPIIGDWNGDGIDTVGLFNPATSVFFLKNSFSGGAADVTVSFGPAAAGWIPIVGDWNGDGVDTFGLFSPGTSTFFLKNSLAGGAADITFAFGPAGAGWKPLAGDWNADGTDTVALFSPSTSTFFLRNSLAGGAADITFAFGPAGAGWTPLAGDWNGL